MGLDTAATHSSGEDVYAVVVPGSVKKCADVLPASSSLMHQTPCPFGVSVYAWEAGQPYGPQPQKLIYVSDQVARDRAPEKNVMNGMGVRPGWYLIARPGRFSVRASRVKRGRYGLPFEDALKISLEVDGQSVNQSFGYNQNDMYDGIGTSSTRDAVFEGFIDEVIPMSGEEKDYRTQLMRPFAFEDSLSGSETKTLAPTATGTITLRVKTGVLKLANLHPAPVAFNYSAKQVSAKEIAREGRTMKVSHSQSAQSRSVRYCSYTVAYPRSLPEADITIYVRERSWLRSRRLIDDFDQPVTLELFQDLLKEVKPHIVDEVINVDEESPKKKPRIKDQMDLIDNADPFQPGEVIDLT